MTLIIFPLIMAIDMFWNRFALALLFPLAMMVLVPISFSSSRPDVHEPKVSCAMGTKWLSYRLSDITYHLHYVYVRMTGINSPISDLKPVKKAADQSIFPYWFILGAPQVATGAA